jgi:hypothetical protein
MLKIFLQTTDALHLKTYLHSFSLFSYMSIINLNVKKQILWYVQSSWVSYFSPYGCSNKNQSNTDIFRIGPIPVSPITTRSESARHFDNCKEKSREILDWLINKGIITWCFSYWPSYRSSVCCIGVWLRLRPIQQASDL